MEPRAHHILIGLFTLIAVGSALLFALWLAKAGADRDYTLYEIHFDRAVSGLAEGNAVLYSGVRVGDVIALRLAPDDPRLVRVLIRVYSEIPIKEDTRASLILANITGTMNVQLLGGTPQSPRLEGVDDALPIITGEPSPLGTLLAESEHLATQIGQLLISANQLLSAQNVDHLSRILVNIDQISTTLADQREAIVLAIGQLNRAGVQAEEALASFARLGERANTLLDEHGHEILTSTQQTMHALNGVATQLETLLATHDDTLEQGLQGFGELPAAMRELRHTLRNLARITQRFEDDPAGFLRGHDTIQEFTP